ncbi:MAG: hypothetical protein LW862_22940, partial [Rubrivivax sp.]|nr:hypothetical protein [Rubrivivax sp.]
HGGFHPSGSGFQVGKLDSLELTGGNRRLKFQLRLGHRRVDQPRQFVRRGRHGLGLVHAGVQPL